MIMIFDLLLELMEYKAVLGGDQFADFICCCG